MSLLDKKTAGDAVRLVIFMIVTTLATGLLAITIGNVQFGGTREYKAILSDATGVVKGDDIRIAGVKVGTVQKVEIHRRDQAEVTFKVDEDTAVTEATHITVKFRNLVGQRYLALSQEVGGTKKLAEGTTIPVDRTTPALDLTVLFNGFKPLFRALSPSDLNKLSFEIIQVFQGEGGTLEGLLADTASVTSTLASRDQVIGELITNLNTALAHIGERDDQLGELITTFRTLVAGLKKDRNALLEPLESISTLSVETASLLKGLRPGLVEDIKQLRRVASILDKDKAEVDRFLQVLPIKLRKVGRTATYGSWFNFYLCEFHGRVVLPNGDPVPVEYPPAGTKVADRCDLG